MGCISSEWDETHFNIFVMKEPDNNIMSMSTFSGLTVMEVQKEEIRMVNGELVKFKYLVFVDNNNIYRGGVDNNNDLRHYDGNKYQLFWKVHGENPGGTYECFFLHSVYRGEWVSGDEIFTK